MDIKLILFAIIFSFCKTSFSQKAHDISYKQFGFIAGTDISNMNFNAGFPTPAAPVEASWKSGINLGLLVHIPLGKNFSLQPEYHYVQRRGSDKSIGSAYRANYLSLPVLLIYSISPCFALLAGPQQELLITAKAINNEGSSNITHDMEERSFGVTGGFNLRIYRSFFLSARYLHGLNHIGIGQRSDIKEFKYQSASLSLEFDFK